MTIEVSAKKVDDAINQGLQQLGTTLDKVTVEVVDAGGLFRKAKVRLTLDEPEKAEKPIENKVENKAAKPEKPSESKQVEPAKPEKAEKPIEKKTEKTEKPTVQKPAKPEKAEKQEKQEKPVERVKPQKAERDDAETKEEHKPRVLRDEDKAAAAKALEFIETTLAKMGFDGTTVAAGEDVEHIEITAPSGDDSLIIGRHGETLSALSYLAETGARAEKCHVNIVVDCNGYRERRAQSLTAMAKRRANEAVSKRRKIKLEPMERIDRRTVHNALGEDVRVITASEGKEPYRYVVIIPKR